MAASVHEISNLIDPVAVAARSEASQLGHKVQNTCMSMQSISEDDTETRPSPLLIPQYGIAR